VTGKKRPSKRERLQKNPVSLFLKLISEKGKRAVLKIKEKLLLKINLPGIDAMKEEQFSKEPKNT